MNVITAAIKDLTKRLGQAKTKEEIIAINAAQWKMYEVYRRLEEAKSTVSVTD